MQDPSTESDQTLATQARDGNHKAFTSLVDRYFGTVWSIAYARLGRNDSADDLAQEVFLVVFLNMPSLSDPSKFAGWLSRITHHRAIDWIRKKQRNSKLVAMVPVENLAVVGTAGEQSAMERGEQDEAVRRALFDLPAEQREIVLLKFAEGLSQKQIAERLDVHPGTISRQMEVAMGSLRKSLGSLDESLGRMRPSRAVAMKTSALMGAVMTISAAQRAALIAACGKMPGGLGAASGGVIGRIFGAASMSTFKGASVVIGIVLMGTLGAILYEQSAPASGQMPLDATIPPIAASPASRPTTGPTDMETILTAQRECYPLPVLAAAVMASKTVSMGLGNLDVNVQAHAVDHLGVHWLGFYYQRIGDGTQRAILGNFNPTRLMGVVTQEGIALPVQLSAGRYPITKRVSVKFDEPWAKGDARTFGLIATYETLTPDADGVAKVRLDNTPGPDSLQQFMVVANKAWGLKSSGVPPMSTVTVGDYVIYIWQKHVKKNQNYRVDVVMKSASPGK